MPKSFYFRRTLGLVIIFASLATAAVIIRYFINNAKSAENISKAVSTDISMKTVHFTESQQSKKKWELFAQNGIYDKPAEKTSLEDVRFIVERKINNGPVTVTAKHGEYQHGPKIVSLSGNVLAKAEDGMTFETSKILYDTAKQTFMTKEKIKLIDEALTVEGVGLDLDVDKQKAIVKSQVEAIVYPGKVRK